MQSPLDFTRVCKSNEIRGGEFINVGVGLGVKMKSKSITSLLGLHNGTKGRSVIATQLGSTSTIRSTYLVTSDLVIVCSK